MRMRILSKYFVHLLCLLRPLILQFKLLCNKPCFTQSLLLDSGPFCLHCRVPLLEQNFIFRTFVAVGLLHQRWRNKKYSNCSIFFEKRCPNWTSPNIAKIVMKQFNYDSMGMNIFRRKSLKNQLKCILR